jgi:hypothetical protein
MGESRNVQGVVSVRPNEDFSLGIVVEDAVAGVPDMTPCRDFGVSTRIKDFEQFRQVRIAVEWDCGVDLDPEFIRAKCRMVEKA